MSHLSLDKMPPGQREPLFFLPISVLVFLAVCIAVFLLQDYILPPELNAWIVIYGAFIPARYQDMAGCTGIVCLSSPVTYSLLHGSLAHLAVNMIWLAAFGAPLAQRIGSVRFILFWAFAALCAAGLHYLLHMSSLSPLIGASGSISGMMGAAARFGFLTKATGGVREFDGVALTFAQAARTRQVITFVGVWMAVNLISGIGLSGSANGGADIAWEAHIGGFLAGFFFVCAFDRRA